MHALLVPFSTKSWEVAEAANLLTYAPHGCAGCSPQALCFPSLLSKLAGEMDLERGGVCSALGAIEVVESHYIEKREELINCYLMQK